MKRTLAAILCLLGLPAAAAEEGRARMQDFVPTEVHGWKADGHDATYDRETLFKYINGAAEVYLTYGFRQCFVRRLVKDGARPIMVEVYDMGSAADAYGIFSFEREEELEGIGQGHEYAAGWLRLWKGPYYVSVLTQPETPEGKRAVFEIGRATAGAIPEKGRRPELVDRLPPKGLIADSVRYFHAHYNLNYHFFVAEENILRLGERTEAVLARYETKPSKSRVLLVRYPNADEAATALRAFIAAYLPESKQDGIARLEDGKWTAAKASESFLAAVFDAPGEAGALALLNATLDRVREARP